MPVTIDENACKPRFARVRLREGRIVDSRHRSLAIELLCHALPNGALVLDARGRPIFVNREGADLLARWATAHGWCAGLKASSYTTVPSDIVDACESLRNGATAPNSFKRRPTFGGRVFLRHSTNPNLSAVIALERSPRDRRIAVFCVLLQDRLKDLTIAGPRDHLAMLTLAERKVAKLVADGFSNSEIAHTLGKSIRTVKSQLGTVFSKLHVGSRTQLTALLRSA